MYNLIEPVLIIMQLLDLLRFKQYFLTDDDSINTVNLGRHSKYQLRVEQSFASRGRSVHMGYPKHGQSTFETVCPDSRRSCRRTFI